MGVDGEVIHIRAAPGPGYGLALLVALVVVGDREDRCRGVVLDLRERRDGVGSCLWS